MANTTADLKIRISVDGKPAGVEFRQVGQAVSELKDKLAKIKEAAEAARIKGDILDVEVLKGAGREIEATIGKLGRLKARREADLIAPEPMPIFAQFVRDFCWRM